MNGRCSSDQFSGIYRAGWPQMRNVKLGMREQAMNSSPQIWSQRVHRIQVYKNDKNRKNQDRLKISRYWKWIHDKLSGYYTYTGIFSGEIDARKSGRDKCHWKRIWSWTWWFLKKQSHSRYCSLVMRWCTSASCKQRSKLQPRDHGFLSNHTCVTTFLFLFHINIVE